MSPQVLAKVRSEEKCFATVGAAVGLAVGVNLLVFAQPWLVVKGFSTAIAHMGARFGVLFLVLLQLGQLRELRLTGPTNVHAHFGDNRSGRVHCVKAPSSLYLAPCAKGGVTVGWGEVGEVCVGIKRWRGARVRLRLLLLLLCLLSQMRSLMFA